MLRAGIGRSGTEVIRGKVSDRAAWHTLEVCVVRSCTGKLRYQHRADTNRKLNDM